MRHLFISFVPLHGHCILFGLSCFKWFNEWLLWLCKRSRSACWWRNETSQESTPDAWRQEAPSGIREQFQSSVYVWTSVWRNLYSYGGVPEIVLPSAIHESTGWCKSLLRLEKCKWTDCRTPGLSCGADDEAGLHRLCTIRKNNCPVGSLLPNSSCAGTMEKAN